MNEYGDAPPPGPDDQARWLANAIRTVRAPATALQWFGVASFVLAGIVLALVLAAPDSIFDPVYQRLIRQQKDEPAEQRKPLPPYGQFVQSLQIEVGMLAAAWLAGSFMVALGGVRMRQLNGYGWAVAGSILAIVPLTNAFCCAGIPIGLWALVTLIGSDMRAAFARVGAAGGLERFETPPESRDEPPSRPIRLE
jgi:hypothetical protein